MPASAAPAWLSLPDEILKSILQTIPLKARLATSTVCSKFRLAAAAATQHITRSERQQPASYLPSPRTSLSSLQRYLTHHGQHILSLQLTFSNEELTQLPCPNLQQLGICFHDAKIQLGPSTDQPGILADCRHLTALTLSCTITDAEPTLAALSAVPKLRVLALSDVRSEGGGSIAAPSSVLQILTDLQQLNVYAPYSVCLHSLKDFLQHVGDLKALQQLAVHDNHSSDLFNPDSMPGFSSLTALTSISLTSSPLDVQLLLSCTQLQSLKLDNVSTVQDGDELLSCIARMTCLQTLRLDSLRCQLPTAASAYTALITSSSVRLLQLSGCELPSHPNVWKAVFPAGRSWPHLQELQLSGHSKPPVDPDNDFDDFEDGDPEQQAAAAAVVARSAVEQSAVDWQDLDRLVSCCPALQTCSLGVQPHLELTALRQLTGLQTLSVWNVGDRYTIDSLSDLTQLQSLAVTVAGEVIQPHMLVGLTQLQALTCLEVLAEDHDTAYADKLEVQFWDFGWPRCQRVWLQLLDFCTRADGRHGKLFTGLGQRIAEQQQQIAQLQQQLAQHQGGVGQQQRLQWEVSQLRHQVAEQREQLQQYKTAQLQQRLAAARDQAGEAVELRGRVQALEGQVQQLLQALQSKA